MYNHVENTATVCNPVMICALHDIAVLQGKDCSGQYTGD